MSSGNDATPSHHQPRPQPPLSEATWNPNAAHDPWRNPHSQAYVRYPAPPPPATEALPPTSPPRQGVGLGMVTVICAITALLAGITGTVVSSLLLGDVRFSSSIGDANSPVVDRDPESVSGVVDELLPSVVTIFTPDGGNGSGFIVSEDGYIMTNHHVVAMGGENSASQLQVRLSNGEVSDAEVVGSDPQSDVAVIKIAGDDHQPVAIADSDELAVGDPVIAVGAPLGLTSTVTLGIVSALDRPVVTESLDGNTESVMAAIQTDAAINPGNSGGALTDAAGQVIGVNTAIAGFANEQGEAGNIGIGFAIPINQAKRIADEIIDTGQASHTVFGASLGTTKVGIGVELEEVVPGSPADDAGLRDGDVLTSFADRTVSDNTELVALVRKFAPGDTVTVTFERDGQEQSAQVTLAAKSKDD
ncbi:S1C family serine protease [Haloglycomyces albus]|uniref:S1C family serine protease n=1 Tax=Haloglycomyces albus TaxID=526067 RepID=UPI00046D2F1A|nr:trypsin-like peptidase domain-containing protein [Haloglycomyces albus]